MIIIQRNVSLIDVTGNQIDHVLVNAKTGSNRLDVRSLKGTDRDRNDFLLKTSWEKEFLLDQPYLLFILADE